MASPFSIYFYGVYGPGLDWLEESSLTSWTTRFFFPHLLEANKPSVIVVFETSGMILFYTGSLGFALGAFQIYREKLLENKRYITIFYRNIRHPLYRALIIASKGLLFVWPRFFVLFGTGTVIFICLILVKTKKKICLAKFPDYADYMNTTGRFLPNGVGAFALADHLWHGGSIYWLERGLFSSDDHRIFCSPRSKDG